MKNIFNKLMFITLLFLIIGCEKDEGLTNMNVSPVEALYAPEDNTFFNLEAQSSAVFEWQAAKAEDNGVVLYDVVFDTEDGDFSEPVYVVASDGKGFQPMLNLPFSELNKIAGMAGIQSESTGKLKWTVLSSKGINVQKSVVSRIIEVKRPGGFPAPDELYITGSATEAGEDLSAALPMKKIEADIFEVYTLLKEGEYQFVTKKEGTPEVYFIEGEDLKEEGATTYSGEEAVYRIRVDFSDGSAQLTEIEKLELWFAPLGEFLFELSYAGNGIWMAQDEYIEFKQESWGRDERYKFKFTVNNGGDSKEEWYGSTNSDNQRPNDDTTEAYWYMVPVSNDPWTNSFKFGDNVDKSNVDIEVIFNTSVSNYTHTVTVLE